MKDVILASELSSMSSNGGWLFEARNVSKRFGHITALDGVDFAVSPGEIVGLVGDNGAGKSTLIKVLSGVHLPDDGQLVWEGQPIKLAGPKHAMRLGISTVYQDLAIVDTMSIFRNFVLGREEDSSKRFGPITYLSLDKARKIAREALHNVGISIRSVDEPAAKLSGGERQSIEIGRAIYYQAKLLIMDEPCSALSLAETEKVLRFMEVARDAWVAVIFITHNVHQVYSVADRFVVLSHGTSIGSYVKHEKTKEELSEMIVSGGAEAIKRM